MTPREFFATVEGYRMRHEREMYGKAWMTAYLLAPWSKKRVTPEQLLGRVTASRTSRGSRPRTED